VRVKTTRPAAACIGFLAASLVPPVVFLSLAEPERAGGAFEIFGAFLGLLFFSVVIVVLFGVPAFLLFVRLGIVRWWSTLGAGAGFGAVLGFLLRAPNPPETNDIFTMAGAGGGAALVFWLVWEGLSASRGEGLNK